MYWYSSAGLHGACQNVDGVIPVFSVLFSRSIPSPFDSPSLISVSPECCIASLVLCIPSMFFFSFRAFPFYSTLLSYMIVSRAPCSTTSHNCDTLDLILHMRNPKFVQILKIRDLLSQIERPSQSSLATRLETQIAFLLLIRSNLPCWSLFSPFFGYYFRL